MGVPSEMEVGDDKEYIFRVEIADMAGNKWVDERSFFFGSVRSLPFPPSNIKIQISE